MFSCEFLEIFKITFLNRTTPVVASEWIAIVSLIRSAAITEEFLYVHLGWHCIMLFVILLTNIFLRQLTETKQVYWMLFILHE